MIEECDCGEGYYLDPSKNLCVVNPTLGQTGFLDNCQIYQLKLNSSNQYELQCEKCLPTHAPGVVESVITSCELHELDGCILANKYDGVAGPAPTYGCLGCSTGYYMYYDFCTLNPSGVDSNTISNCNTYYQDGSYIKCFECSTDGHYGDISNPGSKACVDAGGSVPGCLKYLEANSCRVCQGNKVLQKNDGDLAGSACVDQPVGMTGCVEFATIDGSTFTCLKCEGLYFLKGDGSGCESAGGTAVDNCDEYDGVGSCGDCSINYFRNETGNQCQQCPPAPCLHTSEWKECKSLHNSDCSTAGVDVGKFSDISGSVCVSNGCFEKIFEILNVNNIPSVSGSYQKIDLIQDLGYDAFCFQTHVKITADSGSELSSFDEVTKENLKECSSPCSLNIFYQFRNHQIDLWKQTTIIDYMYDSSGDSIIFMSQQGEHIFTKLYPTDNITLDQLNEGFILSSRKQADFTTDAPEGGVQMGESIYYRLTPLKANDPLDSSKLKVYLVSGDEYELQLSSGQYDIESHNGNEYQKLTIKGVNIGDFKVKFSLL